MGPPGRTRETGAPVEPSPDLAAPVRHARAPRAHPMFRLRVGFVVIAMVLSVFGARLVQLQGLDPKAYAAMAAREGSVQVVLPAERGAILDRNGVPLADLGRRHDDRRRPADDPRRRRGDRDVSSPTSSTSTTSTCSTGCASRRRQPVRVRRPPGPVDASPPACSDELETRGYKGLDVRRDPVRDYPARDVAANLIGFLGDGRAAGRPRAHLRHAALRHGRLGDLRGRRRQPDPARRQQPPSSRVDGTDLQLTIDRDVQWYIQRVLRRPSRAPAATPASRSSWTPAPASCSSLADYPTFDAQHAAARRRRTTSAPARCSDVYEPGSVEKVLTASALIDAGKVTPRTQHPGARRAARPVPRPRASTTGSTTTCCAHPGRRASPSPPTSAPCWPPASSRPDELHGYLAQVRPRPAHRHRRAAARPPACSPTRRCGPRATRTPSRSARASRSTPCRWPPRSTRSPTAASASTRAWSRATRPPTTAPRSAPTPPPAHRVISARAARQTTLMMELVTDADDGVAPGAGDPGLPGGRQDRHRPAGRQDCGCYDGTFTVSFAGFAPADKPAVHRLRRGAEPPQRRRRRLGRPARRSARS